MFKKSIEGLKKFLKKRLSRDTKDTTSSAETEYLPIAEYLRSELMHDLGYLTHDRMARELIYRYIEIIDGYPKQHRVMHSEQFRDQVLKINPENPKVFMLSSELFGEFVAMPIDDFARMVDPDKIPEWRTITTYGALNAPRGGMTIYKWDKDIKRFVAQSAPYS